MIWNTCLYNDMVTTYMIMISFHFITYLIKLFDKIEL
jgi:hypothetical protein